MSSKLSKDEVSQANHAWETLMRTHAVMMRRFSDDDLWRGLSLREYDVLYTLAKSQCELRQSDLLDRVLLSQPAVSRLIDRLVTRGLVERKPDPGDRRGTLIRLTDAGRRLQRDVGKAHGKQIAQYLAAALDTEQMTELTNLLNAIVEVNLDDSKRQQ
ncbi:DNA-binding transcriptional regulator, MarR family [Micrococcales bacterium KH10]|nr:DNA-binding transcriptional regulator, MarR family [Micrococcales bacterium KH10]